MGKLDGKTAVVTGGSGTLCSLMAKDLARQGAKVAIIGRSMEKLDAVVADIKKNGGTAMAFSVDVINEDSLRKAAAEIEAEFGVPDILINGAGGNQMGAVTTRNFFEPEELTEAPDGETRGFFSIDSGVYRNVIEINTLGTVLPCRIFGRGMAARGSGVIVNLASMNSFLPLSRVPAYAMAKAGIVNFTQWLATYLAPAGIRVNGIAPGFFLNERNRYRLTVKEGGFTSRGQKVIDHTPMQRFGKAEELIGTMNYLIDDGLSGFVTGQTISVDGGFLASSGV